MRYRVAFGLFGMSENSSFPSTLRAWFAFAHSSPYRKSNRNDKGSGRSPPYPSPSWGGYLANPLPKLRGNRQNAPSPDWGRLGRGVSKNCSRCSGFLKTKLVVIHQVLFCQIFKISSNFITNFNKNILAKRLIL